MTDDEVKARLREILRQTRNEYDVSDEVLNQLDTIIEDQLRHLSAAHFNWWKQAITKRPTVQAWQLLPGYDRWVQGLDPEEK